jgi:protease-4
VADGRKLPKDKVLEIAKGRIWSGQDAKNLGLVDELGGFDTALKLAKQAAGIPESDEVTLQVFPHKKTFLQILMQREGLQNSEKEGASAAMVQALRLLQPVERQLKVMGAMNRQDRGDDVLRMRVVEGER